MANTWRIVGTLNEKEISRTGSGVAELMTTVDQTFGLGEGWLDQLAPDVNGVGGEHPRAIELVWTFTPEDIWLTPALSALFDEPPPEWFEDNFRLVITLRCE